MDKGVPEARQGAKNVEVRIKLEHIGLHVDIFGECIRNTCTNRSFVDDVLKPESGNRSVSIHLLFAF